MVLAKKIVWVTVLAISKGARRFFELFVISETWNLYDNELY